MVEKDASPKSVMREVLRGLPNSAGAGLPMALAGTALAGPAVIPAFMLQGAVRASALRAIRAGRQSRMRRAVARDVRVAVPQSQPVLSRPEMRGPGQEAFNARRAAFADKKRHLQKALDQSSAYDDLLKMRAGVGYRGRWADALLRAAQAGVL